MSPRFHRFLMCLMVLAGAFAATVPAAARERSPHLLFYVSADHGFKADYAAGDAVPNFKDKVSLVADGAMGKAIKWQDNGILSWNAPGNIRAERGTLSFFWRSRYPVTAAPFVIFRVGYADHSSWDMVWLRIDWNGHGFDAFVTDANLARTRVSFRLDKLPDPKQWMHIAFSWDEDQGVRLYVDGKEVASKQTTGDYDAALDQLGLAGRVMAPYQVQSRYNFLRGSDIDEIRVYDQMLDARQIAALAHHRVPTVDTTARTSTRAWRHRYGWDGGTPPPALTAPVTSIRKVEFSDVRDHKKWFWKGTDGIPETTWPGVYNRSPLPGRHDYFVLPDWNTYVQSGKRLDLTVPDGEKINRIEIRGAAYGTMSGTAGTLFTRPKGVVRTVNDFPTQTGGKLHFTNVTQRTPIQELWGYYVSHAPEPAGTVKLRYVVDSGAKPDYTDLTRLKHYIAGRFAPDERSTVIALPKGASSRRRSPGSLPAHPLPIVNILIPSSIGAAPPGQPLTRSWAYGWENMHDGLDGIAIDLPALNLPATDDGPDGKVIPLDIRIKDPIWPGRDMIDVSVSVKPGQKRTVWLDLRDRILTDDSLWISIASAAPGFDAASLDGAVIRLVFKPRKQAIKEHVADRFNQVRDDWGFMVEEHTSSHRQRLYRKLFAEVSDLLRVDPDNVQGRMYWDDITYGNQGTPPFVQPKPPKGVPLWAFRQVEDLKQVRHFVDWWITHRQVPYGDFGGGISDDTDLTQQWPGLALMGVQPDRINASLTALDDAVYKNGMFSNGLSTIETDELHSYEEGINANSEMLYLNWGDPLTLERLMKTAKALHDRIVLRNPAGHLHFSTDWFGGNKIYRGPNWQWQKPYSFPILHPAFLLGVYNADPTSRKMIIGLADGYLAHAYTDAKGRWALPNEIQWSTDKTRGGELNQGSGAADTMHTFWAAWRWTGDDKYLKALDYRVVRGGPEAIDNLGENFIDVLGHQHDWGQYLLKEANKGKVGFDSIVAWQLTGNKKYLAQLFARGIKNKTQREYMNTRGNWWSDRVEAPSELLQRVRLGGIALKRNQTYPGNTVSWRFDQPGAAVQVALLVNAPSRKRFTVTAYNLSDKTLAARMTGWNVASGTWRIRSGVDRDGDGKIDGKPAVRDVTLETSVATTLHFPPRQTEVFEFERIKAGTPVATRADLGIGRGDLSIDGNTLKLTVHSLGHVATLPGEAIVRDARGHEVAHAAIPALPAPLDLLPKTVQLELTLPQGFNPTGASVQVMQDGNAPEVTQLNNRLPLR